MPRIELFDDNIAILPLETADRSQGGIILPETVRQKSQRGRVLFVGPGRLKADGSGRWPMPVQPDDIAIYVKYAGHEIDAGNTVVTIMKASDLLGCIKDLAIEAPQEEKKVPEGLDRPPCPLCGLEVMDMETISLPATDKTGYYCEQCGFIEEGQDGTITQRMARCGVCHKVDYLRSIARPDPLLPELRVRGCRCPDSTFLLLSPEEAACYEGVTS